MTFTWFTYTLWKGILSQKSDLKGNILVQYTQFINIVKNILRYLIKSVNGSQRLI